MGLFKRQPDFLVPEGGISVVERLRIGGVEQSILIQAADERNPVLLIVHGGPSMPIPGVSSRGQDYTIVTNTAELVKRFVLVFWDQRGTGKSYHADIPQHTMSVRQFISDGDELADWLQSRFNQPKIFLAGHSWGSIVALSMAAKAPHKYYSYTGYSQVVDWTENDRLSLVWTKAEAKRRGHSKALKELESAGEPPFLESFQQWAILRKWQRNFGTLVYTDDEIKHPGVAGITMAMLRSEDYSVSDLINTFYRGFKLIYTQAFIKELACYNFMESMKSIAIPVTFVHGQKDQHVHGSVVERFYSQLLAPQKRLIWAPKSGHAFHPDDTKLNEQYLIEELRHAGG